MTNVCDYGADNTGTLNSKPAFRDAIAHTPAGGTVYIPAGRYTSDYSSPPTEADYIIIDKPITILSDNAVLKNFLFYVKGKFESMVNFATDANEGDISISLAANQTWAPGDLIQILSQYNAYTPDALQYQVGSVNPSNGILADCRATEIHEIGSMLTTSQPKFVDLLMFGNYRTVPGNYPLTNITTTQARRIRPVSNVTFKGITFTNDIGSYRGILARGASNLSLDSCTFRSGNNSGASVKIFDSYKTTIKNCSVVKPLDSFSGSSWNTIIIGGGCTHVSITNNTFEGGAQVVDVTPSTAPYPADPGNTDTSFRTVQNIRISNNEARNASDAITTHPGTWIADISDNKIVGGSTGIRARSRRATISNNKIYTSRAGIALSSFVDDSTVSNNVCQQIHSAQYDAWYTGISHNSSSSEIRTHNNVQGLVIKDNVVRLTRPYTNNKAISFECATRPSDDTWKSRSSRISLSNNTIESGPVYINDTTNNIVLTNNSFTDGSILAYAPFTERGSFYEAHNDDTGPRNISALCPTLTSGTVHLRRSGNTVMMNIYGAKFSSINTVIHYLPNGFKPDKHTMIQTALHVNQTTPSRVIISGLDGGIRPFGGSDDAPVYVSFLWMTADPWPITLPGTAA